MSNKGLTILKVFQSTGVDISQSPCIMAIPEVKSAEEILKKYQECLNIFCPNTHHCTTSRLALCEGLCPM